MITDCKTPDKCRITDSAASTTCVYYAPIYDGHGNNLNPDMNVTSYTRFCSVCDRKWMVACQNGKTTVTEEVEIEQNSENGRADKECDRISRERHKNRRKFR